MSRQQKTKKINVMKKVILAVAVVALGFAATSCKKTYTCACSDGTTPTVKASNSTDAITQCEKKSTSNVICD